MGFEWEFHVTFPGTLMGFQTGSHMGLKNHQQWGYDISYITWMHFAGANDIRKKGGLARSIFGGHEFS